MCLAQVSRDRNLRLGANWQFASACNCKQTGVVKVIKTPNIAQLGSVGEFIAGQRRAAELSLRQLAEQAGVSNPYLSQIERGLRKPSAEVLQQLAKALRVSAESLYVRAGILDPEDHPNTSVEMAVLADEAITERQKRVLIDIYTSFVRENESVSGPSAEPTSTEKRSTSRKARAQQPSKTT
jgi:transcriptional regulator with XRE-family HTH domain